MSDWDASLYQDQHSFVWRFGANLVELLQPQAGERILDIGCGTGQLTAELARAGAAAVGLDSSPGMLAEARKNFPDLEFVLGDAADFSFPQQFDAVFSNAALHWVRNSEGAVQSIRRALRPGGRFVAEFGGKGNIASVLAALRLVVGPASDARSPWYYPSVSQYSSLLERNGLEVRDISLFDRPTQLQGEDGMENWLRMFMQSFLRDLSPEGSEDVIRRLVEHLRAEHYSHGTWTVDYRRLRVVAVRAF